MSGDVILSSVTFSTTISGGCVMVALGETWPPYSWTAYCILFIQSCLCSWFLQAKMKRLSALYHSRSLLLQV